MPDSLQVARRLDDGALSESAAAAAARVRGAVVELVAAVAELELRELHLRQGWSSLFGYCREALGLSEHDAYLVVGAARVARRFPVVLELLERGALNLTTLGLLAPCLTTQNHRELLRAARGKRRAQVEELVALHLPHPEPPPAILKLLAPSPTPVSGERYHVQLTVGREAVEKLRLAREMLRHALPAGDDAAILERALSALLSELARRKFAAAEAPRSGRGTAPGSRHVPAEVKRAVWLRDLGRCAFVGAGGRRCDERGLLEFHHVVPYAEGGPTSLPNLQLRCRAHNGFEARERRGEAGTGSPGAAHPGEDARAKEGDGAVP